MVFKIPLHVAREIKRYCEKQSFDDGESKEMCEYCVFYDKDGCRLHDRMMGFPSDWKTPYGSWKQAAGWDENMKVSELIKQLEPYKDFDIEASVHLEIMEEELQKRTYKYPYGTLDSDWDSKDESVISSFIGDMKKFEV